MQFVLVHGAWFGGWCWRDVERRLRLAGHDVWAPTMTGLGERSHLSSPSINARTHIQDVVNVIRWNDLSRVVLVGHSYGGFIITGVASQLVDRVESLIYLDAFAPVEPGKSLFDISPPWRVRELRAAAAAYNGWQIPPSILIETWSRDPVIIATLHRLTTPHPIACFTEPLMLTGAEKDIPRRSYILCEHYRPSPFWPFYERCKNDPTWRTSTIPALHDAMLSIPDVVADNLMSFA